MPPSLTAAGRVATLTLDEPETRNAITGAEALNAIVSALESDPADIGVLLITGAGPAFSLQTTPTVFAPSSKNC